MTTIARRVLLFGGSGQVGRALQAHAPRTWDIVAPGSADASFLEPDGLLRAVAVVRPDLIVNAAAYTRVDDAELDYERAYQINAEAPGLLADYGKRHAISLVHLSTDYVFDGATAPYAVDHPTAPINAYGRSKQSGEMLVLRTHPGALVVRTSWVHDGNGTNFVGTAVRTLTRGTSMRVVDDQLGVPTRADTVAEAIVRAVELRSLRGIEHVTDAGVASWYDVAMCVLSTLISRNAVPAGTQVMPVATSEFPRPARRPRLSVLDTHGTRRRLGWSPPHWQYGVMQSTVEWLQHFGRATFSEGRT